MSIFFQKRFAHQQQVQFFQVANNNMFNITGIIKIDSLRLALVQNKKIWKPILVVDFMRTPLNRIGFFSLRQKEIGKASGN